MFDLITCGAINWDINLFMVRLPRPGEEVPVKEIQRVSGGTAANVAVASARILGSNHVAFIGALGSDEIADKQRTKLREENVDDSGILTVQGEESGQAYISIGDDGENEIHTYFGANLRLTPENLLDPERINLIKKAKICVIMDPPIETAKRLAEICRKSNVSVIWDPGVYALRGLNELAPVLQNVDYFILNHHEYKNLLDTNDPKEIGSRMSQRIQGVKCIIKRGAEGCTLTGDVTGEILHIDAVPLTRLGLTVVNTVGSGDAFIGGFASGKVEGLEDREALRWAAAAGSFKATQKETRGGPNRSQLENLLQYWGNL